MRCFQIIGLFYLCLHTLQAQRHIPSPLEILTFIEASPLTYEFEQWFGQFQTDKKTYIPFGSQLDTTSSDFALIAFDSILTEGISERNWAERALQTEKPPFEKIKQIYKEQIQKFPSHSFLKSLLGNCYVQMNDYENAIPLLDQAIQLNPYDALAHWQLGLCHLHRQELKKGIDHLVRAHLLNRNHKGIKNALLTTLAKNQQSFNTSWIYEPVCQIHKTRDTVVIQSNGMWLSYGMYKAVWLYEPDYDYIRRSMNLMDGYIQSELEACIGTFMTYINMKKDDERTFPSMDYIGKCIELEILESFILYEKILVDTPSLIFMLNQETIDTLIQYLFTIRIK